jgi:hypothetical protein
MRRPDGCRLDANGKDSPNMAINPTAGAAARADKVRPRSPAAGYGRR